MADLAYVIYTSGSTGRPKGVMVEHRNLASALRGWQQVYELEHLRAHLQMANFSFDVFIGDYVRALCSGATLVICPLEVMLQPGALHDMIVDESIDCAEFIPDVLRGLVRHVEEERERLDGLRLLVCGSAPWFVNEYQRFRSVCGERTRLVNSYGVTEATIDSSFFELPADGCDGSGDQLVPIGRPFGGVRLYVLDSAMQPVPIGVVGELFIGGAGVARGYLGDEALTRERFIPDPFDPDEQGRLYRTGDVARYFADGNIEFIGRLDHQVKIRGFRVELEEVESVLRRHDSVLDGAVIAGETSSGSKILVAYVVLDGAGSPEQLIEFLRRHLPGYMVPGSIVMVDEIPRLPNGKLDRAALPDHREQRDFLGELEAPAGPVQVAIAGIWSELLEREDVGVNDDFFALGGHSLLCIQVLARVRETFELEIPLRRFFGAPTVAALAAQVEAIQVLDEGGQGERDDWESFKI